jgi:predicted DNA-binding ribbon-helix-helix protein
MISERLKKLIEEAERQKVAEDFWQEVNELAEKYEVTVDYVLAEFY